MKMLLKPQPSYERKIMFNEIDPKPSGEITGKLFSKPQVLITPLALQKLNSFIDLCDVEISGLGIVEKVGELSFLIKDVFTLRQSGSGGGTKLHDDAVGELMGKYLAENKKLEELKLWWHSHVNFNVFWSSTDWRTARCFSNNWMLCIVGNKKGEYLARLDIYEPFPMVIDQIPIHLALQPDNPIVELCRKEMTQNLNPGMLTSLGQHVKNAFGVGQIGRSEDITLPIKYERGSREFNPLSTPRPRPISAKPQLPPVATFTEEPPKIGLWKSFCNIFKEESLNISLPQEVKPLTPRKEDKNGSVNKPTG